MQGSKLRATILPARESQGIYHITSIVAGQSNNSRHMNVVTLVNDHTIAIFAERHLPNGGMFVRTKSSINKLSPSRVSWMIAESSSRNWEI